MKRIKRLNDVVITDLLLKQAEMIQTLAQISLDRHSLPSQLEDGITSRLDEMQETFREIDSTFQELTFTSQFESTSDVNLEQTFQVLLRQQAAHRAKHEALLNQVSEMITVLRQLRGEAS